MSRFAASRFSEHGRSAARGRRSSSTIFSRRRLALLAIGVSICLTLGATTFAAVFQQKGLRITVLSQIKPYKLPRSEAAPIAVFIAGHLSTPSGAIPPQLQRLTIDVNRHGLLQSRGLPVCPYAQIQPASTEQALRNCGDALIGSGHFWAHIVFSDQEPVPTRGRLLVFNGRSHGHAALYAQIFTAHPFNSSFVIPFSIKHVHKGPYGTELSTYLPDALGEWGYLDRIKLTLKRDYELNGHRLGYFNAACPATKGAKRASFPLAFVTFAFAGRPPLSATVPKTCGVRE